MTLTAEEKASIEDECKKARYDHQDQEDMACDRQWAEQTHETADW